MKTVFTNLIILILIFSSGINASAQSMAKSQFKSDVPNVMLPSCTSQDAIETQFSTWKDAVVDFVYGFSGNEECDESLLWTISGNGTVISTQICPSLHTNIINLFPNEGNAMESETTQGYFVTGGFDPSDLNLVLEEESEVYITFVWEGAGWTNTLGYYTYPVDNPPTSVDDLEKHVLFENASMSGSGGSLITGDTRQIGNGKLPAGTVIGFYLVAKGWNSTTNQMVDGIYTHYTNIELNPDNNQQHTFFAENFTNGCGDLVMTFEDTRISGGDKDFNDLMFIVRTDVDQLLLDLTPPTSCGGAMEVNWEYTSTCGNEDSGMLSFEVNGISEEDVIFELPANMELAFNSQSELNSTFDAWLADASWSGGCESGSFSVSPSNPLPPNMCGGFTDVTWIYEDNCVTYSHTRRFTANENIPVVSCPDNMLVEPLDGIVVLDGAEPTGGSYEGPGVSYNEESGEYLFDPIVAGEGEHLIFYSCSNEGGCVNSCVFTVEVLPMPDFSCIPDFAVCHDDEPVALVNTYYDGGVFSGEGVVEGNSFDPSLVDPGIFEITYTLENEVGSFECIFFITVNEIPEVSINPFEGVCTNDEPATLSGGMPEGGTYTGIGVTDGMFDPNGLEAGVYEIEYSYTNENGCTASATSTIEVMQAPCIEIAHSDVSCFGEEDGSIQVTITCTNVIELCLVAPGENIDKCDPNTKIGGAAYTNLVPGTYYIVATNINGCTTIEEVTINETSPVEVSLVEAGDVTAYQAADGFIEVTGTGGTPGYEYLWSIGETTPRIEYLNPGEYSVVVFDSNNCSAGATYTVGGPSQPSDVLVDLGVTIEVNIATPDPEEVDELTFALVITNHHTFEPASSVSVTNVIPEPFPFIERVDDGTSGAFDTLTGTWTVGTLQPGEYKILVYRTGMLLTEAEEKSWQSGTNTAEIMPFDQTDPNLLNNYAEVVVTVGESSGGGDNGIESNGSMASQLALRNHRRLAESPIEKEHRVETMKRFDQIGIITGQVKTATVDGEFASGIASLLPENGPANTKAFVSTPADLIGITNASEIFAVDYLQENNSRRAGILAIATPPSTVYEHTKVICDRLAGAELRDVRLTEIAGKPFIMSQLVQPNGYVDYAVSFIAQRKGGQFVIDNRWYNEEYEMQNSDDVFNFQVWGVTPQFTEKLVEEIINSMELNGGVTFENEVITPAIPKVYVHSGRYINGGLLLNLINEVGASSITLYGNKTTYENGNREPLNITVEIPYDEFVEVFVPTGYIFDAGFSISNNKDDAPDVLYYSDGAWMFDYDRFNAEVTHFATKAETNLVDVVDFKVERDVTFSGRVRTWATLFRTLSPRQMLVDMTGFDQIVFSAKGEGIVEVMLAKQSINQWSEQYRTTITLSETPTEFIINYDDLATREGIKGFTAEDLVSVIFNPIGNGNNASNFDIAITNLHFNNSNFTVAENAIFHPAFPNPFTARTSMQLVVKQDSDVKMEVVNVFGQTVEVLRDQYMSAGNYRINWTPAAHQPGVYMIRTTVGTNVYSSKVVYRR